MIEIIKSNDLGSILEKHRNDNATATEKRKAWNLIYKQWTDLQNVSNRTLEQLQTKWKSIVKLAKSEDASRKWKMKETGGGEPPRELSQTLVSVNQLLSHTFSEIPNPFGGDSANSCQTVETFKGMYNRV